LFGNESLKIYFSDELSGTNFLQGFPEFSKEFTQFKKSTTIAAIPDFKDQIASKNSPNPMSLKTSSHQTSLPLTSCYGIGRNWDLIEYYQVRESPNIRL
jgi:hypothetical protein